VKDAATWYACAVIGNTPNEPGARNTVEVSSTPRGSFAM
jgi:hypothetical protein